LIDSDLEEKPELLKDFFQRFIEANCEVVYGVQKKGRVVFGKRLPVKFSIV